MFDEKLVISQIKRGDTKSFSLLVKQYERLVYHVVNRLVSHHEDVEDICQEVFIKVHKHLNSYSFESKLSTWIARIAYLTAIDYVRKYRKMPVADLSEAVEKVSSGNQDPEQLMAQQDLSAYVNLMITQLPEQYRIVLTLYHLNDFSYEEIEQITGMPQGTIKNYMFRARKQLKEKLDVHFKNDDKYGK